MNFPASRKAANTAMFITAIVGPIGVDAQMQMIMPTAAQNTEIAAEHTTTLLKLLNTLIAESAGKVMSDEISSAPTIFIAITMTTPVTAARRVL